MELHELLFWLWRASWQASVLVLLILVAQWVFKTRLAPKWRYALWLLVVVRLALPVTPEAPVSIYSLTNVDTVVPAAVRIAPEAAAPAVPEWFARSELVWRERNHAFGGEMPDEALAATGTTETERSALASGHAPSGGWGMVHIFGVIWLAGVLFFFGRLILGNVWFARRLRGRAPLEDRRVLRIFERCAEEMGVGKGLAIVETPDVQGPALFAVFRMRLLLPPGMVDGLSDEELRYVFLHELAHIRRRDVAVNWFVAILQALHWFNPVLWLGFRRMRIDRELACDALALSRVRNGEDTGYGRTILKVLQGFSRPAAASGLVGILEGRSGIRMRIHSIARFRKSRGWPVLAGTLFGLLAVVALTDRPTGSVEAATPAPVSGDEEAFLHLRVVNATTGQPLAGTTIEVNFCDDRGCYRLGSFETSGEGEVAIVYPSANLTSLTVYAVHPDFAPTSVNWAPPSEAVPEEHLMQLAGGATAGGVIQDEAGRSVEGAKVDLVLYDERRESTLIRRGTMVLTTDAEGRWRASGIPEPYENLEITVTHSDFPTQRFLTVQNENRWVDPVRLETAELMNGSALMELKRGYRIEGRVVDSAGDSVEEAMVFLAGGIRHADRQSIVTEADGRFAFRWLGYRETMLFALLEGYGPAVLDIPAAHEAVDLELRLPPGREMTLTVVDVDGDAIPEASVIPTDWNGIDLYDWRGQTDDAGRFTWSSAPEDAVRFSIGKAGYVRVRDRELTPGEENIVVLDEATRIAGRVTDAETGEPIEEFGIQTGQYTGETAVHWNRRRPVNYEGGRYELTPSEPVGTVTALRVEAEGYVPAVTQLFQLTRGEQVMDFSLDRSVPISGRVLSPEGAPLAGVEVALLTPNSNAALGPGRFTRRITNRVGAGDFVETDAQGRFSLSPDPAARMILFVHEQGYAEFSPEEFHMLDEVRLQQWGRIEGEAIIGGNPVGSVAVGSLSAYVHRIIQYDHNAFRASVGEDGRFTIDPVPPGWQSVHAWVDRAAGGYSIVRNDYVEVEPGGVTRVRFGGSGPAVVGQLAIDDPDLEFDWQDAHVTFGTERPRWPDDADRSDVNSYGNWARLPEVRRAIEEARRFRVFVSADGTFRVDDVPPGRYEFTVSIQVPVEPPSDDVPMYGSLTREVIIPEVAGDESHDLGEMTVVVDERR